MKRVVKTWAKISSMGGILLLLLVIIYRNNQINNSFNTTLILSSIFLHSLIIGLFTLLVFYIPLFYFAWNKMGKNKIMKIWAKIVTILLPLYIIYSVLQNPDWINILIVYISLIPLYYFGWTN